MSNSGRKDFDVKHILRLRWKLFSHPASPAGGCLQQDSGSFEHWGPSQSRLLKNQERTSGAFWKKASSSSSSSSSAAAALPPPASSSASPRNGTSLSATRLLHGVGEQAGHPPAAPRTVFYVESLEEGSDWTRPQETTLVLREVKAEPAPGSEGGGQSVADRHRIATSQKPLLLPRKSKL
uniref:Kelch-like protein 1 n=1 Tax=Sphaerodactylus townsendi TaxID=933632 RepID=A0ACB8FKB9_9SAUR